MKTSTEINSTSRIIGEEKAIELIAKAGFDAWDLSMFDMARYDWANKKVIHTDHPFASPSYAKFIKQLKQIGLDNGIICNQSHAPFPICCQEIKDLQKRAIECTAIAGGKHCIIHPDNNKSAEENAEFYLSLIPFAKEHDVIICTENMWNWDKEKNEASKAACSHHEDFVKHIDLVSSPYLAGCLDIGHAAMKGLNTSVKESILALSHRLQALHIHDNDMWHDSHQIPFTMDIDFEEMVSALKQINYKGYITLEADSYLRAHGYNKDNVFEGVKNLANAARKIANMFDN